MCQLCFLQHWNLTVIYGFNTIFRLMMNRHKLLEFTKIEVRKSGIKLWLNLPLFSFYYCKDYTGQH